MTKNEENWQNPNRFLKFLEIWYVDASQQTQQKKMLQDLFFGFLHFLAFLCLKIAKIDKNEENWQNPNRLLKFTEIWYVDASQQKKMLQNLFYGFLPFFCLFLSIQQPKLKKMKKIGKIQIV